MRLFLPNQKSISETQKFFQQCKERMFDKLVVLHSGGSSTILDTVTQASIQTDVSNGCLSSEYEITSEKSGLNLKPCSRQSHGVELQSKTKPLTENKMERAGVIGCIRVARKLMPLETVCK